jgi:hypothetical protein
MIVRSDKSLRLASFLVTLLLFVAATQAQTLNLRSTPSQRGARGSVEREEWRLAFELAFGEGSPYSSTFPSLYDERLSYEVRRAITKDVLDRIVRIALRETGARRVELSYRPGGYNDFPVVPSAQLSLRASDRQVAQRVLNIIGYLAQQTLVIGSKKTRAAGNRAALEIIETGSGRHLADRRVIEKFWRRLAALSPKLGPGFSAIEKGKRPGIYIIDSDGDWRAEDFAGFDQTVRAVSTEFRIRTSAEHFQVEYAEIGNDWKTNKEGASYLDRLSNEGRSGLSRRLVHLYQPRVERWIRNAFKKHAPGALRKSKTAAACARNGGIQYFRQAGQATLPDCEIFAVERFRFNLNQFAGLKGRLAPALPY